MKATYRSPALTDAGSFRERTGWGWGGGWGGWGWGGGWGGWGWGGGWGGWW